MHWKATARRGTAVVKEREPDADQALLVVLDRRVAPAALEVALAQVCERVLSARDQGRNLRLCSQGFDSGPAPRTESLLRWLATAAPLPGTDPAPPKLPGALQLPHDAASEAR
jgi:uncharacterized protein (DUF58 family)